MLSAHDCLSLRFSHFAAFADRARDRLGFRLQAAIGARFERRWYGRIGHVIVTSKLDADQLERLVPAARLSVVPNGVTREYISQAQRVPGRIVFTGNMSFLPNEDAANYFAQQIFPLVRDELPAAEFWIVGSSPSPRVRALSRLPGVIVTGTVPCLSDYIQSANVYVSPLRFGAGVKNKILEAMAASVPIVATPISLSGTPLVSGRHLLVAESPSEIATAILKIINNPALADALSQESRREIEARYAWHQICDQIDSIYSTLLDVERKRL